MRQRLFHTISAAALALAIAVAPITGTQALSVFDGANYSQNLLTAARTLEMIRNQIQQLQNQAQMLINMARHLERLDYSSLSQLRFAMNQINLLMNQARGIAFEVGAVEAEFAARFPERYEATVNGDALAADARARWEHAMDAYRHTLLVQSQVAQNVQADATLLEQLVTESQASVGSLQAQQAGNQLLALQARQQLQTQQLMAAQYRARALDDARRAQAEEQARAQFARFLGDGSIYDPAR